MENPGLKLGRRAKGLIQNLEKAGSLSHLLEAAVVLQITKRFYLGGLVIVTVVGADRDVVLAGISEDVVAIVICLTCQRPPEGAESPINMIYICACKKKREAIKFSRRLSERSFELQERSSRAQETI